MTRKSKQAGGNLPLTHYEKNKKFKSSEYGTTSKRLAGHSQYQLGDCALSLTRLSSEEALCSPSGYLYSEDAILEYLLTKTQEIKEQQALYEAQEAKNPGGANDGIADAETKKRVAEFEEAQKVVKKSKSGIVDKKQVALQDLKRTSYWLADAQPDRVERQVEKPPERPLSPHTQTPLRRKDLWRVRLQWDSNNREKLVCAVSGKPFKASTDVVAYWTDKKHEQPGTMILGTVYEELVTQQSGENDDKKKKKKAKEESSSSSAKKQHHGEDHVCPITSRKIRHTRTLQKSGSSFATSEQQVQVQKYAPTLT